MEVRVITLVPSKLKTLLVQTEKGSLETTHPEEIIQGLRLAKGEKLDGIGKRLEIFLPQDGQAEKPIVLLGVMGGAGQGLFFRALDLGITVRRIPIYKLQRIAELAPKSLAQDRARALRLAWESRPKEFYPLFPEERNSALVRVLARDRLFIQEVLRKPTQLRFYSSLREARFILPMEAEPLLDLIYEAAKGMFRSKELAGKIEEKLAELEAKLPDKDKEVVMHVLTHLARPEFVLAMERQEVADAFGIEQLLKGIPIAEVLQAKNSGLPQIKGLGPVTLGGIVGEVGDIRRFPNERAFRAYARQHLVLDNGSGKWIFPARRSGNGPTNWNRDLHQFVWLLAATQLPRYSHVWKLLYEWRKAIEIQRHPEPIPRHVVDRQGRDVTIYDYSLKHLDSRAKRWVASKILEYIFGLWKAVAKGDDPGVWYKASAWPIYFSKVEKEMGNGLASFLKDEIQKRRRQEPKEESAESVETYA